jgi:hypothetical protein
LAIFSAKATDAAMKLEQTTAEQWYAALFFPAFSDRHWISPISFVNSIKSVLYYHFAQFPNRFPAID